MMYAYRGVRHLMVKSGLITGSWRRLPLQWHLADGLQFQTALSACASASFMGCVRGKKRPLVG